MRPWRRKPARSVPDALDPSRRPSRAQQSLGEQGERPGAAPRSTTPARRARTACCCRARTPGYGSKTSPCAGRSPLGRSGPEASPPTAGVGLRRRPRCRPLPAAPGLGLPRSRRPGCRCQRQLRSSRGRHRRRRAPSSRSARWGASANAVSGGGPRQARPRRVGLPRGRGKLQGPSRSCPWKTRDGCGSCMIAMASSAGTMSSTRRMSSTCAMS
mmetsp:Transcript_67244/g.179111  ORF Transcript_67244/g.179111 Transcript_67244/m.179111 type:complete len:214 (-) Transcript_67244:260-901(-)